MTAVDKNNNNSNQTAQNSPNQESVLNPAASDFADNNTKEVLKSEKAKPINLLPTEFKPKKSVLKISKTLNKVAIVTLVVFLILGSASFASVFVIKSRAGSIRSDVEQLTAEVSALEQAEQRLILIKDRVNKISKIKSDKVSIYDTVVVFKQIYDQVPDGLEIVATEISSNEIITTVNFTNSSDLARFLAQTVSGEDYSIVKINSLSALQDGGLSMQLVIGT